MKKLKLPELSKINGGASNHESMKIQDGYLTTTLHIPPHEFEQCLDVYLVLQNPKK